MGRKIAFPSLFKKTLSSSPSLYCSSYSSPWPWPSCKHPRTRSFRAGDVRDDVYKTVNSVYYLDTTESRFTNSSGELASESLWTASEKDSFGCEPSTEAVIRALQSDRGGVVRLFFEPGDTSSIMEESKSSEFPFQESVVMAMDSKNPYADFRLSMEEMVVTHGLRDWDYLEELLEWYLRVNGKTTHCFIVGAFVDLLLELFSPSSSCSSSCSVPVDVDEEDDEEQSQGKGL